MPGRRGLRLRRPLPLRRGERRARRAEAGRAAGRLLRRLDHGQLVEGGLRRLLPGEAVREPRHRRPDDGADAAAVPRRRGRAPAEGGGDPGGDERHRRQRRPGDASSRSRTTWPRWRSWLAPTASRSSSRRSCPCPTTRRTRTASPSPAPGSGRPRRSRRSTGGWSSTRRRTATRPSTTSRPRPTRAACFRPELNDDGLHPNARGYAVMAPLAEKAIAQGRRRRDRPAFCASSPPPLAAAVPQAEPRPAQRPGATATLPAVRTELVQIDVVVTDKDGRCVVGSPPGSSRSWRTGSLANLSHFAEEARPGSERRRRPPSPDAAPAEAPAPAAPTPRGRYFVLAVDDLHTAPGNMAEARRAMTRFVDEQVSDDDLVALATTSGTAGVFQDFTRDRAAPSPGHRARPEPRTSPWSPAARRT